MLPHGKHADLAGAPCLPHRRPPLHQGRDGPQGRVMALSARSPRRPRRPGTPVPWTFATRAQLFSSALLVRTWSVRRCPRRSCYPACSVQAMHLSFPLLASVGGLNAKAGPARFSPAVQVTRCVACGALVARGATRVASTRRPKGAPRETLASDQLSFRCRVPSCSPPRRPPGAPRRRQV